MHILCLLYVHENKIAAISGHNTLKVYSLLPTSMILPGREHWNPKSYYYTYHTLTRKIEWLWMAWGQNYLNGERIHCASWLCSTNTCICMYVRMYTCTVYIRACHTSGIIEVHWARERLRNSFADERRQSHTDSYGKGVWKMQRQKKKAWRTTGSHVEKIAGRLTSALHRCGWTRHKHEGWIWKFSTWKKEETENIR